MMMRTSCEEKIEKKRKKKMEVISIIPPTSSIAATNEWSQGHQESDFLPAPGGGEVLLKQMKAQHPPLPPPPQQDQGQLRCPRCDSSNTKFCYYNNYSFSQPRHLCKSCKRYWTRGGTLRNVPVGGGCRKNKRAKRPSPVGVTPAFSSTAASRAGDGNAPVMFSYRDPQELDLPYAALGFSSGIGGNGVGSFIPDFAMNSPSNSVVPGYGARSSFLQTSRVNEIPPSMASLLLASTIFQEQQKFMSSGGLGLKPSCPLENNVQVMFDEGAVNWSIPQQGQFDEIGLSDLSASCWNTFANGVGSWYHNESGNIAGSSIPSLI